MGAEFNQIVPLILKAIEWVLVPFVLVALWGYGFYSLPTNAGSHEAKAACRYARWAGLILFVLFVVSRKGRGDTLSLKIPEYDFNWWLTILGTVFGFFFSWFIEKVKHIRAVAFVVLVLVASMSISFYCYLFVQDTRVWILFLALGFALGTLLDKAFSAHLPLHSREEREK